MAYEAKTKPGTGDVDAFVAQVEDAGKRADSQTLIAMMREISGDEPVLWGTMVGFGKYQYRYDSGHSGEAFRIGFSPRKAELSLYVLSAYAFEDIKDKAEELLARLGKHRAGKSCLYIKRLSDVDMDVLRDLTELSWQRMARAHPL
jgi:hypothetical protein